MNTSPLVSIIINNHNYARYVPQAIDSALAQAGKIEVIVVDDGSTDSSPAVLYRYGSSIKPIFQSNGGQASAFNTGWRACRGEIVMFLDADDALLPDIVPRVLSAFQAHPDAVQIQFRLQCMDARGALLDAFTPPARLPMPSGDLCSRILRFPDDVPRAPTSGNSFRADVLRKLLPMPENDYRICADYYLLNLAPLYGTVVSLSAPGALYRLHAANHDHRSALDLARTRAILTRSHTTHHWLRIHAHALGMSFPDEVLSVTFLANRMLSLKLAPQQHPFQDTVRALLIKSIHAAFGRIDVPLHRRATFAAWFIAVACAPSPLVLVLAENFYGVAGHTPLAISRPSNFSRESEFHA